MEATEKSPSLSLLRKETTPFGETCLLYRHRSGLRLALIPKDRITTAVYLGVPAGSLEETPAMRRSGFAGKKTDGGGEPPAFPDGTAHFLEHKLFENEDGEDSFEKFAAYGANANAFTGTSKTVYLFTCSEKEGFLPSLRILVEGFLHPYFTAESIAREREIITQEILLYEDDPDMSVYYGMLEGLFGKGPLGGRICGSPASIGKITKKTLYSFYRTFYGLSDAVLCICGRVTADEILPLLDALLPPEKLQPPAKPEAGTPDETARRPVFPPVRERVLLEKELPMPLFCIGLRGEPFREESKAEDCAALSLFAQILFDDFLSALYEKGVVPEEPRYDYEFTDRYGYLSFSGQAEDPEEIFTRFKIHIKNIAEKGISEKALSRAGKTLYAHYLRGFDDSDGTAAEWISFLLDGMDLFDYGRALLSTGTEKAPRPCGRPSP